MKIVDDRTRTYQLVAQKYEATETWKARQRALT